MSSMVSGGKRLLNQISSGLSYQPQGEVRLVSHVFSNFMKNIPSNNINTSKKVVATVMTYTSKNELVTFDVLLSPLKNGATANHKLNGNLDDENDASLQEERAMMDMVLRSQGNQLYQHETLETERVHLNLSTAVKPENLKELAAMRLLEQGRQQSVD